MSSELLTFLDTKVGGSNWQTSRNPSCPAQIYNCGNGIIEPPEVCDSGGAFNGMP
jgi:hypothetical protein